MRVSYDRCRTQLKHLQDEYDRLRAELPANTEIALRELERLYKEEDHHYASKQAAKAKEIERLWEKTSDWDESAWYYANEPSEPPEARVRWLECYKNSKRLMEQLEQLRILQTEIGKVLTRRAIELEYQELLAIELVIDELTKCRMLSEAVKGHQDWSNSIALKVEILERMLAELSQLPQEELECRRLAAIQPLKAQLALGCHQVKLAEESHDLGEVIILRANVEDLERKLERLKQQPERNF
jgi:hypothetical protein